MEYVKFGNTGLDVSWLTLGCMSFGAPDRGYPKWTFSEKDSRPILKKALDLGRPLKNC
jgi:aryl-alcohol dehydrogenase-like predicted oxidoreductase